MSGSGPLQANILIVDDEHTLRHALVKWFSRLGYNVSEASTGPEALKLIKSQQEEVRQKTNLLDGIFATLSVDLRAPWGLLVLKEQRPLCLHYEPELGALFFSSRYLFLRRAFGRAVLTEALESGHGFYFDARTLPETGNEPQFKFKIG
jgi:CheY-like chemotaxis protein